MHWLRFVLRDQLDYIVYWGKFRRGDGVEYLEFVGGVCVEDAVETAACGREGEDVGY